MAPSSGVQFVGAEDDGDPELALQAAHQIDDALLVARVEADQRLVEQQQAWIAEQCLGEHQALALAAGHAVDRASGERPRLDQVDRAIDLAPSRGIEPWLAPAMTFGGAGDEIAATQAKRAAAAAALRQIADRRIATAHRTAEDTDLAGRRTDKAECRAHQRRLAGAVGTEHAEELAVLDFEADLGENGPAAERDADAVEGDSDHGCCAASAFSRASSWDIIHC